jgi:hypothetical protein
LDELDVAFAAIVVAGLGFSAPSSRGTRIAAMLGRSEPGADALECLKVGSCRSMLERRHADLDQRHMNLRRDAGLAQGRALGREARRSSWAGAIDGAGGRHVQA